MTTLLLAKILGPIVAVEALGLLLNKDFYEKIYSDFEKNNGLTYIAGIFTLLCGLLMVLSHNVWTLDTAGLITFLAWAFLLKGVAVILFPRQLLKLSKSIRKCGNCLVTTGVITLILGGLLIWVGYF